MWYWLFSKNKEVESTYRLCIKASTHNLLHQIEFISKIFPVFHIYASVHPLGSGNIIQALINQGTLYAMVNWFNRNIKWCPLPSMWRPLLLQPNLAYFHSYNHVIQQMRHPHSHPNSFSQTDSNVSAQVYNKTEKLLLKERKMFFWHNYNQ